MVERSEEGPPQSGGENVGVERDVTGQDATGGPGERRAADEATPPIADEAEHGQTTVPAPADEVGVPPDEEMNRPDA